MSAVNLSVVILTFNEQRNIGRCIDSIKEIADDIVVVDSYSKDDTVKIAKAHGARVIEHPFEGYIEQKNFAITQAKFPHILSLDADEMIDAVFRKHISEIKKNWTHDGYSVNRLNNYCGQWIRHGAWYPDKKLRLWDSRKGKWSGTNPHDRFEMYEKASILHVSGNILHYSYQSVEEHKKKAEHFSSIAAKAYSSQGRKSSILKIMIHPFFRFIRDYFIKRGFMDGKFGWIIAVVSAHEVSLKYKKLYSLQHNK
jgi:glycosyltransferase involved in cell wall biosynthesis